MVGLIFFSSTNTHCDGLVMHFISRGLVFQTGQMQMDNTEKKKDGRMGGE